MSSGFVSTKELDEEKRARQEQWEKVRKPDDALVAPEPEVCNQTLFEQLRNNKEVKQAEIDESKKFKNMIRGIDDEESDFLAQVDNLKQEANAQKKKEELEMLKEMAKTQTLANSAVTSRPISLKPCTSTATTIISKQASILSSAIKRKSTTTPPEDAASSTKVAKVDAVPPTAIKQVGVIKGIIDYDESSDSGSSPDSSDDDDTTISTLRTNPRSKKQNQGCGG